METKQGLDKPPPSCFLSPQPRRRGDPLRHQPFSVDSEALFSPTENGRSHETHTAYPPLLLLGLWLALSTTLQAQPVPLFEEASVSMQALGPQAQQRQQVLQKLPMAVHLQLVRLPEELWRHRSFVLAVNAAGRLVPGRGKGLGTLTVRREALSVLSEEAVAWNGRIYVGADTTEAVGEVSLVVLRTGAVTGHVLLGIGSTGCGRWGVGCTRW
ncbi:hypothetical protein [Rhodothermus profundi]|nr:hypothetical protein [Rhodothermus profundi]